MPPRPLPTLGCVTGSSGDAASRLSAAIDQILQRQEGEPGNAASVSDDDDQIGDADWAAGLDDDQPVHDAGPDEPVDAYELPEIVPATVDVPVADDRVDPQLPTREANPSPVIVGHAAVAAPAPVAAAPVASAPAAAWGDLVPTPAARPTARLRPTGRRPRVRRVTRVVRHVDPWSVFKVALIFSVVAYLVVLTSGVLLWRVAESTGTLDNVERWFTQFGWETFELKGGEIFSNAWVIGLFAAVGLTGAAVLLATLFNLASDIVGGIRVTVLEEEVVERTASSARRYVVRRPPLAESGSAAAPATWAVDDDEPIRPPDAVTAPTPSPHAATAATRRATTGSTDWSVDD